MIITQLQTTSTINIKLYTDLKKLIGVIWFQNWNSKQEWILDMKITTDEIKDCQDEINVNWKESAKITLKYQDTFLYWTSEIEILKFEFDF